MLIEARVLDRQAGGGRERENDLLVLSCEVAAAALLREIEVAERLTAHVDRDAEEGPHRRMVRRKPERLPVLGDVRQSKRAWLIDQQAEYAAASRQVANLLAQLLVDPDMMNWLSWLPLGSSTPSGGVLRVRELGGGFGDAAQDRRQVELRADRHDGLEQCLEAVREQRNALDAVDDLP